MSSTTGSETSSPTTEQVTLPWEETNSQPGGLTPAPRYTRSQLIVVLDDGDCSEGKQEPNSEVQKALEYVCLSLLTVSSIY